MSFSLVPDRLYAAYTDITPQMLQSWGIRLLLCDLDYTLAPRSVRQPDDTVLGWVQAMKDAAPGCNINTTTDDPHGESWRFTGYDPEIPLYYWVERYELLRHQLGYNYQEYSFYWLDPLCDLEAPAEHAGKYGKEVYGL